MSYHKWIIVPITLAWLCLSAAPLSAQFEVHGSAEKIAQFGNLLLECSTQSPLFTQLLKDIDTATQNKNFEFIILLEIQGNPGGQTNHTIDTHQHILSRIFEKDYRSKISSLKRNAYVIDVEDLKEFPMAKLSSTGKYRVAPIDGPSYAPTRCQMLGHELKEQLNAYTAPDGFDAYAVHHAVGLDFENQMRKEIGQKKRSDDKKGASPNIRWFSVGAKKVVLTSTMDRIKLSYP